MWKPISYSHEVIAFLVIAKPIPILQVCRESRTVALEYCTKIECEQASLSFVEDDKHRDIRRHQDLKDTSPTFTYLNWHNDIVFLECGDCSFNVAIDFLCNDLQKTRYLLLDKGFSGGNPQISTQVHAAFNEVRQLIWVTPRRGLESWDLKGPLILEIPPAKSDDFVAMCSRISTESNIRLAKSPKGAMIAEADVDTPKDIRYWPVM
jgi:hypothetical protein